ncbi:MAG: hypothetical protein LUF92_03640 [Clostridiales bacterium]|nr:hypothetical protein [Clostridiales bacterium]
MADMTNNELLLAISDMMDKKLKTELQPLRREIEGIKKEQTRINMIIENEMRPAIKLLVENYVPAVRRYETTVSQIKSMQSDIGIMKKVIAEHSEKLQIIS